MSSGFEISATALRMFEQMEEVVAANMADTAPGAKRIEYAVEGSSFGEVLSSMPKGNPYRDFSPGSESRTGSKTDIAIIDKVGDRFFSVKEGAIYTRDGEFHWKDNTLVDVFGNSVDGDAGQINRTAGGGEVNFDFEGNVFQGGQNIGRIATYQVISPQKMKAIPGGYELTEANDAPIRVSDTQFAPESLEKSNVSPMKAMTDLSRIHRAHEASAQIMRGLDESLGHAARYASS